MGIHELHQIDFFLLHYQYLVMNPATAGQVRKREIHHPSDPSHDTTNKEPKDCEANPGNNREGNPDTNN